MDSLDLLLVRMTLIFFEIDDGLSLGMQKWTENYSPVGCLTAVSTPV